MKKIIKIIVLLVIILFLVVGYKVIIKKIFVTTLPDKIVEFDGQKQFIGANWGLKSLICEESGFDILDYAGEEVMIKSSLAVGKFYKMIPLDICLVYREGELLCKYYTNSLGRLTPGVFAYNDPNIFRLW